MYTIEKNLNKLNHNQPTFFLDPKEQQELRKKLKNKTYQKEVFEILTSIEIPQKTKNGIKKLVIKNPLVFRRDKKEAIFLFIFALLNWI